MGEVAELVSDGKNEAGIFYCQDKEVIVLWGKTVNIHTTIPFL